MGSSRLRAFVNTGIVDLSSGCSVSDKHCDQQRCTKLFISVLNSLAFERVSNMIAKRPADLNEGLHCCNERNQERVASGGGDDRGDGGTRLWDWETYSMVAIQEPAKLLFSRQWKNQREGQSMVESCMQTHYEGLRTYQDYIGSKFFSLCWKYLKHNICWSLVNQSAQNL